MKLRLHGTEQECITAAGRLGQVLGVLSVSRSYPDRGTSLVRVYVEARLDPVPVAPGQDDPVLDPDCRDGKHGSCIGAQCACSCHRPSQ